MNTQQIAWTGVNLSMWEDSEITNGQLIMNVHSWGVSYQEMIQIAEEMGITIPDFTEDLFKAIIARYYNMYVITETSSGVERDAYIGNYDSCMNHMNSYSEEEKDTLQVCMYKILKDGNRTTEF